MIADKYPQHMYHSNEILVNLNTPNGKYLSDSEIMVILT